MENLTKALLMVAGMFLAIMIISLLVVFYNEISGYYEQKHEMSVIEQTQKFNSKFEAYNKDNIRGSDLISLMNKVIDYNASQSYQTGTNYKRIIVTITLGGEQIRKQFKYETTDNITDLNSHLTEIITNSNAGNVWVNDKNLVAITNTPSRLSNSLAGIGISNITDAQLQQLTTGIGNIITHETEDYAAYNRLKRAELIHDVLGITLNIDSVTGKTIGSTTAGILTTIKNAVSQYYQYMQFKRAYFECTEMEYDTKTDRVVEIKFKLKTKIVDGIETVIFK